MALTYDMNVRRVGTGGAWRSGTIDGGAICRVISRYGACVVTVERVQPTHYNGNAYNGKRSQDARDVFKVWNLKRGREGTQPNGSVAANTSPYHVWQETQLVAMGAELVAEWSVPAYETWAARYARQMQAPGQVTLSTTPQVADDEATEVVETEDLEVFV